MGCIPSKNVDSKTERVSKWRTNGVVTLQDSKLKIFPDEILELDRVVRTVDLTHNKIVDIPVEINKFLNMQRLILSNNLIEHLPMNMGKLKSLKIMTLDGNRLTGLPDELGQLIRLEQLSVSNNLLTYLPETLGSLRKLKILDASNNKLSFLPESIGSCFSLEELHANDNYIDDLPSSVCNLIHLKLISLDNNKVKQMPSTILTECVALRSISLRNNPLSFDDLEQMEGFEEFEARSRKTFHRQNDSKVVMNSKGLGQRRRR